MRLRDSFGSFVCIGDYLIISVDVFDSIVVDAVETIHETIFADILVTTKIVWVHMATLCSHTTHNAYTVELDLKHYVNRSMH